MRIADLAGRRVAVWGHGREGRAAIAALRARLPELRLTLFCSDAEARQLDEEASRLPTLQASAPGSCGSGGNRDVMVVITEPPDAAALSRFDVVIKSPGISLYRPEIRSAQQAGVRFTSGTALWFGERPEARVIAVTGTKGKSTTAAMIAHCARALGVRTALAGNIGLPLLELLDAQADLWVVELSSFQTGEAGPVEVGVVTSLYEEHLDWHGSLERYVADKLRLAGVAHTLVVNATQPDLLVHTAAHPRRVLFGAAASWHIEDSGLFRGDARAMTLSTLQVRGVHNVLNACAALAALDAFRTFDDETALHAAGSLADFTGLPHRMQTLETRDGTTWIDDSISTTPEATLAALRSLADRNVAVIVGGHDRGVDWSSFATAVAPWASLHIIAQGASGPRIARALRAARVSCLLDEAPDLAVAVAMVHRQTSADRVVLLSPGAPSFDQFRDYAERGRAFAALAGFDPDAIGEIEGMGIA